MVAVARVIVFQRTRNHTKFMTIAIEVDLNVFKSKQQCFGCSANTGRKREKEQEG